MTGTRPMARAWSMLTMSRSIGSSETGISLKLASPSGMPMIVTHSTTPATRCPSASHQLQKMNQMMLPMPDAMLASARLTTVFPNGHSANMPIRSDAMGHSQPE